MTNEEAIARLQRMHKNLTDILNANAFPAIRSSVINDLKAVKMAIKALKKEVKENEH